MMDVPRLTICTLNCRGIGNDATRRKLYTFLRTECRADIICLQETNTPAHRADFWTQVWAGPAVWFRRVGILLHPTHTLLSHTLSHEDRLLCAEVSVRGCTFAVANMYAPAKRKARLAFFATITTSTFDPLRFAFIAGDWNCCPVPSRDRTSPLTRPDGWLDLAPSITFFFDGALMGATEPYFTFRHSSTTQPYEARLDHVFVSTQLASHSLSTRVLYCSDSDHKAVCLTVTPSSFQRPLLWRLNTSLLTRSDLWISTEQIVSDSTSSTWDACKVLARSTARDHAVVASHDRKMTSQRLQRQLRRAEQDARAGRRDLRTDSAVINAQSALRNLTDTATSRAILRARVRWLEEGERCSAYFFSRHRDKRTASRLSLLQNDNGQVFATAGDRHAHIRSFYTSLYAAPTFDGHACHSFLDPLPLPSLEAADIALLSAPVTAEELAGVVGRLPLRKSPGPDGLPYEWYRTYLPFLAPLLLELFNGILNGDAPPASWFTTTLTLLPKPDRDPSTLRNWRPITLANCDAKLFSKILANRLATVLPRLLHPDQAGFVKGRSAPDAALAVKAVLAHAATAHIDGALVFLDQEKAYDRVSHDYLLAVLQEFGFPSTLAHIYFNTSGPSHSFILDDGQPLPAVPISCGVRQGDPLAPLLFNLAFEPMLMALRLQLMGVRLPWGSFIVAAFADDPTVGLSQTDVPALQAVLAQYGRASNGRVNITKSRILDLSGSPQTPPWIQQSGFPVHAHSRPIRVLGFDLLRSPEGVQENWQALLTSMRAAANKLRTRSCALQGRALLVNSKVLSKLWYKGRLSSPSGTIIKSIRTLAWAAVWDGSTALTPGVPTGQRPPRLGGVGFLDPEVQLIALQAMWMARFLTARPHPPWWKALDWVLSTYNGDRSALAAVSGASAGRTLSACWRSYYQAWCQLQPHWTLDISEWTVREALCFPVPVTHSAQAPSGLRLVDLVSWNPSTSEVTLLSPADVDAQFGAPVRVRKALTALRNGSSTVPAPVLQLALSASSTHPRRSKRSALHVHIQVAGVLLLSLTTSLARRFLDQRKGIYAPFDWRTRGITQLGRPPSDIWSRLHHRARTPRLKETYYKFLFNALPLGCRARHFRNATPEMAFCHYCPGLVQTQRHFIFSCPLAQCLWQDFRSLFSLPQAVSLQQAAFSWSPQVQVLGRRYGFRLQAGHAVVVHTLWLVHCRAGLDHCPASIPAVRALFRALLLRHLETLWASTSPELRSHFLEDWSPPLGPTLPLALL